VRYLGTTDDVTSCDCCGRRDLKSTVALEDAHGNVMHYGTVCAARKTGEPVATVTAKVKAADAARQAAERAERDRKHALEAARWQAFLDRHAPGADRFKQIEALGGFPAARARFKRENPRHARRPARQNGGPVVVRETHPGFYKVTAGPGNAVYARKRADGWHVVSADTADRGRGYGIAMYRRLADMAAGEGVPLHSDFTVSEDAARVWYALERRGYCLRADTLRWHTSDGERFAYGVGQTPPFAILPKGARPNPRRLTMARRRPARPRPHGLTPRMRGFEPPPLPPDPLAGEDPYHVLMRLSRTFAALGDERTAAEYRRQARRIGGGRSLRPNRGATPKAKPKPTRTKPTTAMRRAAKGMEAGKAARNDYYSSWAKRDRTDDYPDDEPRTREQWERDAANFWEAVSYAGHGAAGGTKVGALLFDGATWTKERAIVWAKAHGYSVGNATVTKRKDVRLEQPAAHKGIPIQGRKAFGGSGITAELVVIRGSSTAPPTEYPDDYDYGMVFNPRGSSRQRGRGRRRRRSR
jgi:GNAT superfamily N-acetyltransferase